MGNAVLAGIKFLSGIFGNGI
jgi:cation diffusion facilitator family transporter